MKKLITFVLAFSSFFLLNAQTPLNEAVDFNVETIDGDSINLFSLLDDGKIVVIDFFFTYCIPCQQYAPDFQEAYEEFGENEGNVIFMGMSLVDMNEGVHEFDSIYGLTYPSISGYQGGGSAVNEDYAIECYPTVIVITPDHQIAEQKVWLPTTHNIIDAVFDAGGKTVGFDDQMQTDANVMVYPNPVAHNAFLKIDIPSASNIQYEIVDLLGNIIFSSDKHFIGKGSSKFELPLSGLINGLYFVRLAINNTQVKTSRFIVAR